MPLTEQTHLCYLNVEDLWQWIKENNLIVSDFAPEQEKWNKEVNQKPNFFSDTELLLIYQDILLLKVLNDSQENFLAKTYQLKYQNICQKLFQDQKNIVLISEEQWKKTGDILTKKIKEQKNVEKAIVLWKDQESGEKSLASWLTEMSA